MPGDCLIIYIMLNSQYDIPHPIIADPVTSAKICIFNLLIVSPLLCDRYKPAINTSIQFMYYYIPILDNIEFIR